MAAGELGGAFADVVAKTDVFEGFFGVAETFCFGDTRDGKGEADVAQDGLVRDEVVALEDEANAVVSIRIPGGVAVAFGRDAIDEQVAGGVAVEAADDIEKGGFAGAGRAEDAGEFTFAEVERDRIERLLFEAASVIDLGDFS